MFGTWRTPVRVCDEPPSFAKRDDGSRPTVRSVPGPLEVERVEVERVEAARHLEDLLDPVVPRLRRIGLVEAADVHDVGQRSSSASPRSISG